MFRPALTAALVVAALPALAALADDAQDEAKKLEGDWNVTAVEAGGKTQDPAAGAQQVVLQGDQLTLKMKGGEGPTYRFTVDPSQKPKAMDWLKKDGSTIGGIYELDGDDLKLCFPLAPAEAEGGGARSSAPPASTRRIGPSSSLPPGG